MARLRRERDGSLVVLLTEHIVGRLPSCHLPLDASFVSTAHALLRWNGEAWDIRDLGSTNGTYVDGARIEIGESVRLQVGVELVFGDPSETWQMIDARAPIPVAIPQDGGEPSFFCSGTIPIPTASDPLATIYDEGDRWLLEIDDAKMPLRPGQRFFVAGREWKFECPSSAITTRGSETSTKKLANVTLAFEVSSDEENVTLRLKGKQREQDLGRRACFYLALVLVRERLKERNARIVEPGWIEIDSVLKMIPDYTSYSHLNVEIFRLRRVLYDAGVQDAAQIIERRRGQIRFGTERVEILCPDSKPEALR